MDIFITWSGDRSKAMATELSQWLRLVNHYFHPWMSERDIPKGARWFEVIGNKLSKSSVGIICVTPENLDSTWLHFEAGAISKALGESRVCPILLGMLPEDVEGPLAQFQATTLTRDDIFALVKSLNNDLKESKLEDDLLRTSFLMSWPRLSQAMSEISKMCIDSSNMRSVIRALDSHGISQPEIGRLVCFREGFESHVLYQAIAELSDKRLYIWGRKNRKLFDKEHYDFFRSLNRRVESDFDFRCLFLDPNSSEHILSAAHQDSDFRHQLETCIENAIKVLQKHGVDPDAVCRAYNVFRHDALIVSDNIVVYTPVELDTSSRSKRLTKCGFQLVDSLFPLGQELLGNFQKTWESSVPITEV